MGPVHPASYMAIPFGAWYISSASAVADEAWAFLMWWTSAEVQRDYHAFGHDESYVGLLTPPARQAVASEFEQRYGKVTLASLAHGAIRAASSGSACPASGFSARANPSLYRPAIGSRGDDGRSARARQHPGAVDTVGWGCFGMAAVIGIGLAGLPPLLLTAGVAGGLLWWRRDADGATAGGCSSADGRFTRTGTRCVTRSRNARTSTCHRADRPATRTSSRSPHPGADNDPAPR